MYTKIGEETKKSIEEMISTMKSKAERGDNESAHGYEDDIRATALESIVKLHESIDDFHDSVLVGQTLDDCFEISRLALTTESIEFARYYI